MTSNSKTIIAFDLYGTLLSTESIAKELASHFGDEKAASSPLQSSYVSSTSTVIINVSSSVGHTPIARLSSDVVSKVAGVMLFDCLQIEIQG